MRRKAKNQGRPATSGPMKSAPVTKKCRPAAPAHPFLIRRTGAADKAAISLETACPAGCGGRSGRPDFFDAVEMKNPVGVTGEDKRTGAAGHDDG